MRFPLSKDFFIPFFIFIVAFSVRFYRVTSVPPGLGRDEVSVAYNAYSILKTGRDEHGRFLPLYFEAIGDQKLPVIIYISVPSIALFGLTEIGARLPFVLFGSLTVVFLYLFLKKAFYLNRSIIPQKLIYLAPLLFAVNPWHLGHSRAVYEIILGTFFFMAASYSFLHGLKSKFWFFISVIFFLIAFYTYSLTRLLSPLLFIFFCFIYRTEFFQFPRKFRLLVLIFLFIFLLPFIINFFDPGGIYGSKGAVILSSSRVKSSIMEFRSYVNTTDAPFLGKLLFNSPVMTVYEYGKNLLTALSPEFFFARGSYIAGIGTHGLFYMIEFLPLIIGLISAVKNAQNGNKFFQMLIGWIVLTFLSASLTVQPPYPTRTLFLVVPFTVIIAFGWIKIINFYKKSPLNKAVLLSITLIYLWNLTFYFISYYFRSPVVFAQNWESKNKELFAYLKKEENNFDTVIITKPELSMYAFFLFYHQIPPDRVWTELERHGTDPDGWRHGKKFGKYEFRSIDWVNDFNTPNKILLVSQGNEYSDHQVTTTEILYPEKFTVFPYGLQVVAYPEKRVAFRIWKFFYNPQIEKFDVLKE